MPESVMCHVYRSEGTCIFCGKYSVDYDHNSMGRKPTMNTHEARAKMDAMTLRGRRTVITKHVNGTCKCYVPEGQGINGTRNSGKDCVYACLSGSYQNYYRQGHKGY